MIAAMAVDAASLRLRMYPDPVLRVRGGELAAVTDEVRGVAEAMFRIMREHDGIGLAAPQVGLSWRMFVLAVPETDGRSSKSDPPTASAGPLVFINPVLSKPTGPVEVEEEGCLSLPDIRGDVLRPPGITCTAMGLDGKEFTIHAGGLLARCIQHENDHLDGVLILDRMTQPARLKNRRAVRELEM